MTNNSTKLAMYAVLAAAALMCCDRPAGPAAAAATASVPPASCATDALAVKCREGAKEYQGPRFGLGGQAYLVRGLRHA